MADGFEICPIKPSTCCTRSIKHRKIKGNNTIYRAYVQIGFMGEYIEKSIVDDTAELLTERGLTP